MLEPRSGRLVGPELPVFPFPVAAVAASTVALAAAVFVAALAAIATLALVGGP